MLLNCGAGEDESPLNKEMKPVNPKGNQSRIFIGSTDAEVESPVLQPPDTKSWLIGKDLDTGKDWEQEEKGVTEKAMVGWHHWLNGHEFEQTPGMVKDREAWRAAFHGVTKSWTWLSYWTTTRWKMLISQQGTLRPHRRKWPPKLHGLIEGSVETWTCIFGCWPSHSITPEPP